MSAIPPRPDPGQAPTTPSQRRDWNAHHLRADNSFLNLGLALEYHGCLEEDALRTAVDLLVSRHEALRTRVAVSGGDLVQIVEPGESPARPRLDRMAAATAEAESSWLEDLAGQPFDLLNEVPFRVRILGRSGGSGLLGIVMHHIVSDHLSLGVVIEDLAELLSAQIERRAPAFARPPAQFPDYAAWWDDQWRSGRFGRQLAYWRNQLAGAPERTWLPAAPPASANAADEVLQLPAELARGLPSCAAGFATTPYVVLLAVFASALARLTDSSDQVFACGYANRPTAALRRGIGRFVSGMALRIQSRPDAELADFVTTSHAVAMGGYANAAVSLDALLESRLLGEPVTTTPFANVAFQLVEETAASLRVPGLSLRPLEIGTATTKRDLHVTVVRQSGGLAIYATFRPSSIAPQWVRTLLTEFADRLGQLTGTASRPGDPP